MFCETFRRIKVSRLSNNCEFGIIKMSNAHIQFSERKSDVDFEQLRELFKIAAFWASERSTEDLSIAVANSEPVITVKDGERLIGFARATSDGIYRATIWDVVIHPDYRSQGLGSKLVETVLSHPKVNRVERTYLMTTHRQGFYEKIGFEKNSTTTMVIYNQSHFNSLQSSMQFQEVLGG